MGNAERAQDRRAYLFSIVANASATDVVERVCPLGAHTYLRTRQGRVLMQVFSLSAELVCLLQLSLEAFFEHCLCESMRAISMQWHTQIKIAGSENAHAGRHSCLQAICVSAIPMM